VRWAARRRENVRDGMKAKGARWSVQDRWCEMVLEEGHTMLVERKKKKEQKDVPRSTKESRDSRGRAVEPWLCRVH
jgi:hypothetical protein